MPYYSDKDRKRSAAKRKLNSQFRQLMKSPEDSYDILGITVPRVHVEPQFSDYGLPNDAEQLLATKDSSSLSSRKAARQTIFWSIIVLLSVVCAIYIGIVNTFWLLIACSLFIFGLYAAATDVKPEQTTMHKQYNSYKQQQGYYEYWQRKKSKDHWNNMTGRAFEQATANLFRDIDFKAEVSNQGGDGGIDIILQKSGRRIAVQCKRYKSTVGPHVIRDLWGTMHSLGFNGGCIVTTTGFTKGVRDFAVGKKIYLIELNDILRANNRDGKAYLKQKIGDCT